MAAEKSKRSSIGDFFTKLFRPRSASLGKDGIRKPESVRKKPKSMSKSASFDDSFGIEATDRLTHFQKPKPPPNRRRPRGLPSLQQSQQHEVEAIKEEPEYEDVTPTEEVIRGRIEEPSQICTSNGVKLFTPALPSSALRKKSPTQVPMEVVAETKIQNRSSANPDNGEDKKKISDSLKSLSEKIDFYQLRNETKAVRLAKSLEVGQAISAAKVGGIRSSDPGRQ